ncbi:MAG: hypothetical protein ACI8WB_000534 [Phenylobacterium sp.]|jgi:hypothetical protein
MKPLARLTKFPIRTLKVIKHRHMKSLRNTMLKLKMALSQEKAETREMLHIYHLYAQGEATPEEMKAANEQFLDILKGLGLGVFAVLPFSPVTIPAIVKLGRMVGVEILPSAFSDNPPADNEPDQPTNPDHHQNQHQNQHQNKCQGKPQDK